MPNKSATNLSFNFDEANRFLKLLGKDPSKTWFRCLSKVLIPQAFETYGLENLQIDDKYNIYFVTGNANYATGKGGGVQDTDIIGCPALFIEWDDKPIEWQLNAWQELGLPKPSVSIFTGGKSIHHYWILNEPMAPDKWEPLISRLISHCGADKANKNPSRLMRLPGSIYFDKTTGKPTDCCLIIAACERRYAPEEIELALPPILPKAPLKAAPKALCAIRAEVDIKQAAAFIPARIVGGGTYEESRNALCGCSAALAEAGVADPDGAALELLGHLWADAGLGAARQVLDSTTTRNAASYWKIAGDQGFPLSCKRSEIVQSKGMAQATAKKVKKQKYLSHSRAIECFNRCVYIQSIKECNSFRRRVRLLKVVKDLGLSSYINRVELASKILEIKQSIGDCGFKALSAADRIAMKKPVIHWLLPGLLPANDLTILGGRPKVGKTRLAVAMAASV